MGIQEWRSEHGQKWGKPRSARLQMGALWISSPRRFVASEATHGILRSVTEVKQGEMTWILEKKQTYIKHLKVFFLFSGGGDEMGYFCM